MSTIFIAVITALLTTIATDLFVKPRLEASNRRRQEVFRARERFGADVFTLLTQTGRLQKILVTDEASSRLAKAMDAERARWIAKIDEATIHLIDETETFSLSYGPALGIRELAFDFAAHARAVWLSERPLAKRLKVLEDMATYAQDIYFVPWWRKRRMVEDMGSLRQLIDDVIENRR